MSFLAPAAFGLLAVAPVVILLYLLKQHRRPTGVPTLMFWRKIVSESKRHVLFRKLRQWLSLLVQLAILALIILAIAKPEWGRGANENGATVLVIDARARMQAGADSPEGASRFSMAINEAKRAVRSADPSNPIMIIAAAGSPTVKCSLSGDEQTLIAAIDSIRCSDAGGKLEESIRLAASLIESQPGARRILVFSDERIDEPDTILDPKAARLAMAPIGHPAGNVGITRLSARPLINSPQTNEILAEVSNFQDNDWEGEMELYADDRLFDVRPLKLRAGESSVQLYPAAPVNSSFVNTRGWLTAKINSKDALLLDNVAYAVLPAAKMRRILLLSEGNLFLERLLSSNPSWRFDLLKPGAFKAENASGFDVVIFDGVIPEGFDPKTTPGGYLFLNKHPFAISDSPMPSPVVTGADKQSPLLRLVRMDEVSFAKATTWKLDSDKLLGWQVSTALQSGDNPLIVTAASENRSRFVALAFDPMDTDLPMRVAFPLLVANSVNWLAERGDQIDPQLPAGTFAILPKGAKALDLPQTKMAPLTGTETPWVSVGFEPEQNGFYLIQTLEGERWIGVNTDDARMSDLRKTGGTETGFREESVFMRRFLTTWRLAFSGQWPPWIYCAFAAVLLLTLEWGWFHRRKTE